MIPFRFPLLFVAALAAGVVDAIAGGGGLITVPVLLAAGVPPPMVLGTNKLQSTFGSFTSTRHYAREGLADIRAAWPGVAATAIGAAAGAWCVEHVSAAFLARAIPALLLVIAAYLVVSPRFGHAERRARLAPLIFYPVCGLALGFYDGFFGPGTGSFWAMAFVVLAGMNFMRATAHTKLMNFTSNAVALAIFLAGRNVLFAEGLCMAVGQIAGARLGAGMAVRRGVGFIRPIFIAVAVVLAAKLLYDPWS